MRGVMVLAVISVIGLAIAVPLLVLWQADAGSQHAGMALHEIRVLALLVIGGAFVLGGLAIGGWVARENIRAWRMPTAPPVERHVIREVRIDGRPGAPTYLQMPEQPIWPEAVRMLPGAGQMPAGRQAPQLPAGDAWQLEPETADFQPFERAEHWH